MLQFSETEETYRITETTMGGTKTETKVVDYTKDLMFVRVNNDPWRETCESARAWFKKYHACKFEATKDRS